MLSLVGAQVKRPHQAKHMHNMQCACCQKCTLYVWFGLSKKKTFHWQQISVFVLPFLTGSHFETVYFSFIWLCWYNCYHGHFNFSVTICGFSFLIFGLKFLLVVFGSLALKNIFWSQVSENNYLPIRHIQYFYLGAQRLMPACMFLSIILHFIQHNNWF